MASTARPADAGGVMKPEACYCPKMLRLAELLPGIAPGLPGHYALDVARARMDDLWNWFWGRYFKGEFRDGRLAGVGPIGIASAARFPFDGVAFTEALVAAGFLDRAGGVLAVHDFTDHMPKWVRDGLRDETRGKKAPRELPGESAGTPAELPLGSHGESREYSSSSSSSSSSPESPPPTEKKDPSASPTDPLGADATEKAARPPVARKPVTQHAGLIGDMARAWVAQYPELETPTWGREAAAVGALANKYGEAAVRSAWDAYLAETWDGCDGHSLTGFVARGQFDKWRARASAGAGNLRGLSAKGRRTAQAAMNVLKELEARDG